MITIKEDFNYEIVIEKSRFITYLHKTTSEDDAKAFIASIKKLHPQANHHCQAFVIGDDAMLTRCNDDGEPSGTAGVPMLECLKKAQMTNVCAVVVRYFGGIKLGAGGLIRAYTKSVSTTLEHAQLVQTLPFKQYRLSFDYSWIGKVDHFLADYETYHLTKDYDLAVNYEFYTNNETLGEEIYAYSNGVLSLEYLQTKTLEVAIK